jgi:hypothetical protein
MYLWNAVPHGNDIHEKRGSTHIVCVAYKYRNSDLCSIVLCDSKGTSGLRRGTRYTFMMQNLLVFVADAVWCLIGLLLVVGITAIIKLKPRAPASLSSALSKDSVSSTPWEKFRGRAIHTESPGWQKVFETHREPSNAFISSRWEDLHFASQVRSQNRRNKRIAEPKRNMGNIPSVRTYSLRKRYEPTGLMTTEDI